MKLFKSFVFFLLFALFLSACGTSTTGSKNAEEILEKSVQAMSEVKSYSMEMKTKQLTKIPGVEEDLNIDLNMTADIITEPLQLYMVQNIQSPELGTEEMITTESYFTSDGFYMKDSMTNQWFKYKDEIAQSFIEMQKQQMNFEEQLNLMKRFTKNISVKEDNKHYILNLEADGKALKEIVLEVMNLVGDLDNETGMFKEIFNDMDIHTFTYKIYIDKETFYQTKIDMETNIDVNIDGETMSIKQSMEGTIDNFNDVKEIKIPQEAIDNAEEVSF